MIAGAALFIGAPLGLSVVAYLVNRWRLAQVAVAMATAALLALAALRLPLEEGARSVAGLVEMGRPLSILGRTFTFEAADRPGLVFMFLLAMFLFGGAAPVRTPRAYLPVGVAILGLLAAALFIKPFLFAALFLEMAVALAAFMLCDDEHPATRGAVRWLVFVTLGMPFILLTGWLLEGYAISPGDQAVLVRATVLLAAGFAVLLAVAPFHTWIPTLAENASPFAAAFVFTVIQSAVIFFMLNFLNEFDWLRSNPAVGRWLSWAGVALALVGGAFALAQRNFGRLMGYAVVADMGATLLAVGLGTASGLEAALAAVTLRGVALAVWGLGVSYLRAESGRDDFDAVRGLGRQRPAAAAAAVLGGLSLVGFPLTAGFPARWALMLQLAPGNSLAAAALLFVTVSVGLAYARALTALVARTDSTIAGGLETTPSKENVLALVYLVPGIAAILALGLFPQWLLPSVARAAQAFTNLR